MRAKVENLLQTDHAEIDSLLVQIFAAYETNDVAEGFRWLDLFWARLAMHIRAEHLHLFPALIKANDERAAGEVLGKRSAIPILIENLHRDHDFFMRALVQAIKLMRPAVKNEDTQFPSAVIDHIQAVKDRLAEHNVIEERKIYPLASTMLSADDYSELVQSMKKEIENMPPRFR